LPNSDFAASQVFWIGVYPGLTSPMLDYVVESLREAVGRSMLSPQGFAPLGQANELPGIAQAMFGKTGRPGRLDPT
jgi:hypothetical protein